ncbi:hypothetical protein L873DRAFT_1842147 [Choiromyces venosus 120613-1]|uniref:Tc1-like transposase DDE domain-containing protein n=1 Tax=Choiromyces venosus 120613-1 TaxID=1336337 RepID=A0A3N4JUJ9_9PEZI|nr:hypothetical protein L873DRAFT_1842147 [Choiromyces venosus 120613-1]
MPITPHGKTSSLAQQSQIVAYANLKGSRRQRDRQWRQVEIKISAQQRILYRKPTCRHTHGVLYHPGEAYLPQNLNRKFPKGATVMFWGVILYGHKGSELPYHLYPTPYETKQQISSVVTQLHHEWEREKTKIERYNLTPLGILNPQPLSELKERGKGRKGGIDWFIYHERIQLSLLFPFALTAQAARPGIVIMEDNTPAHIHHYHNIPQEKLGLQKLVWPVNSPGLNPIETIWIEMKDLIKKRLGIWMTASGIHLIVEEEWENYPVERIN